jgi:hypothetical protein
MGIKEIEFDWLYQGCSLPGISLERRSSFDRQELVDIFLAIGFERIVKFTEEVFTPPGRSSFTIFQIAFSWEESVDKLRSTIDQVTRGSYSYLPSGTIIIEGDLYATEFSENTEDRRTALWLDSLDPDADNYGEYLSPRDVCL